VFVFWAAYCVAAHVILLQLSCSHCIQKNIFLRTSLFAIMYHVDYGVFFSKNCTAILHIIQVLFYVTT